MMSWFWCAAELPDTATPGSPGGRGGGNPGEGVRLHIGASVEQQTEDRLSLTVLGAVPVVETSVSPSVVLQREVASQTVLVPEEKSFLGEGKTIIQPAPPAPVDEPERHPEPDLSAPVPVPRRDERELKRNWCP